MAKVRIRIDDFEDGLLPGICAASGADGARLYHSQISSKAPAWVWLLVFGGPGGILLALLVAQLARKVAHGYLPYADAHQAVLRARSRRLGQGFFAALAAVVCGLLLFALDGRGPGGGFGRLALLLAAVAALGSVILGFLWSNLPGSVGGHLDGTGRWIELDPVAPRFAEAYERQEQERREARRAEVIGLRRDR